jgi:UDP-glucose 4-epimerase
MRVLVTGGAGFIGSHVVDRLCARGDEVAVIDNLSSGRRVNLPPGVAFYEADLRDGQKIAAAFAEFAPQKVVHLAAQISVKVSIDDPRFDVDVNIVGGVNVLLAARAAKVEHLVFSSTGGAIYGEVPVGEKAHEGWPARPKSTYAASKASFESYLEVFAQSFDLPSTVLRFANVYGPRQDPHGEAGVVAIFCRRLLAGKPVTIFGQKRAGDDGGVRDYVYVGDVADAVLLGLDGKRLPEKIFNVGTGEPRPTREVLATIARAVGVTPTVEEAPPRAGDLEVSLLDYARIAKHGWRPRVAFAEGIGKTVEWFRATSTG